MLCSYFSLGLGAASRSRASSAAAAVAARTADEAEHGARRQAHAKQVQIANAGGFHFAFRISAHAQPHKKCTYVARRIFL